MSQSIIIQVGQCGNQIGCQFWDLALREHASVNKKGIFDEAMSSFFRNFHTKGEKEIPIGDGKQKLKSLRARAILVDMEEGVVNQLVKGPLGEIFDYKQLLTSQSGSGNNWAVGYKHYGNKYCESLRELIRRSAEACDYLQTFFLLHSMGGGTGSGIGTALLKILQDDYPDVYRFAITVYPSADDDVITSPYNSVLAMRELTNLADCVLPIDNQALLDICNRVESAATKFNGRLGCMSLRPGSCIVDSSDNPSFKSCSKPFDRMNNIVANLLLNLTSSSRFDGSMNVDLNEITTNLIPFPRLHYLMSSMVPLYGSMDMGLPLRSINNSFTEAFSRQTSLMSVDPKQGLYMATAVLLRGKVSLSDIRSNINRLQAKLKFVPWNREGWKTGLCSVAPTGNPYSLLTLSNNTCVRHTFEDLQQRFDLLFRRKAHLHHYLQVDGMEMDDFESSVLSMTNLISEYKEIENNIPKIPPQLQVIM